MCLKHRLTELFFSKSFWELGTLLTNGITILVLLHPLHKHKLIPHWCYVKDFFSYFLAVSHSSDTHSNVNARGSIQSEEFRY